MANVRLDKVTKVFPGGAVALEDVDLTVRDGEFLVLVGPSGCGKSTVLRVIAGLEEATSGTVSIDGEVVDDVPPKMRDVAMVFQNYALYPHMSVRDNLGFGCACGTFPRQRAQRVRDAAQMLGIEELLDRKPKALSGGQRQRVATGRAIVRDPRILLMDEPLSNLDAQLRVSMRAELSRLHAEIRTTTVYVTHDQVEAMTFGDRIAVLDAGRLQQIGTPHELYHRPANTFVAGFIGSPAMNLAEVEVRGGRHLRCASGATCGRRPPPGPTRWLPSPAVRSYSACGPTLSLGQRRTARRVSTSPSPRQSSSAAPHSCSSNHRASPSAPLPTTTRRRLSGPRGSTGTCRPASATA